MRRLFLTAAIVLIGVSHADAELSFTPLGDLPGGDLPSFFSTPSAISSDGTVVIGNSKSSLSDNEAFRWTASDGMSGLGVLSRGSYAYAVSLDGSVIVGSSGGSFRWTEAGGMQSW